MRVLLIGFGTVGQGVAETLLEKSDYLAKEKGMEFSVLTDLMKIGRQL